jgi:hypothetical protein
MEDCDEVTQLTNEGFDKGLVRRALAFADMNVDTARGKLHIFHLRLLFLHAKHFSY